MENCLVTKLKGEVRANLPFYDGIRFVYTAETLENAVCVCNTSAAQPIHIKTYNSNYEFIADILCAKSGNTSLGSLLGSGSMGCIYPASNITRLSFNIAGTNIPTSFCVNVKDLGNYKQMREVRLDRNVSQVGDIAEFSGMENLEILWLSETGISGKIDDLHGLKSLTNIRILERNDVAGDFAVFVQNMRECEGRGSGSISLGQGFMLTYAYKRKRWTYNGKLINPSKSEPGSLVWDATKSYLKKGIEVFCLGYTNSEIETNTASGGIWEGATVVSCD